MIWVLVIWDLGFDDLSFGSLYIQQHSVAVLGRCLERWTHKRINADV